MASILRLMAIGVLAALAACSVPANSTSGAAGPGSVATLDQIALAYTKLVLALGEHDGDYVDAYYGPADLRDDVKKRAATLPQIEAEASALLGGIDDATATKTPPDRALLPLRRQYLKTQIAALVTRAQMLQGRRLGFDEEARLLYDTEAPHYSEAQFAPALARLDQLLTKKDAGAGTLSERYNRYLDRYAIPKDRIEAVMQTAIAEAQKRSHAYVPTLPQGERFELSLVHDKPWSAYNWYQGGYVSRIEVNTMLPIPVSRVIDLAAHEGYPGHHVYNALLEARLVRELGWPEFQVYALFSPQSLIAEGSADYGVSLAFPGADKLALTRELFTQSGFDPKQAETYLGIVAAARELAPAGIEAARRYLDGVMTAEQTAAWLQKMTLSSPERAKQRVAFFDKYRAYVINYTYGEEIVRRYIEASGGAQTGSEAQWIAFTGLLSTPRTPAGIAPILIAAGSETAAPKADAKDIADFDRFIATHPTLLQFHERYPDINIIPPGTITTREYRSDRSRYFPELDAQGRITGGHFE